MKIGNFKSTKKFLLQVFRANEVAQFPSEDPNFHLVYNSSNLGFFVCPHGSSLWEMRPQPTRILILILEV